MSSDDKPHIPKIDETRPVVWTPEDASRFLTSAIHEAQKPLAEALKQRPITSKGLTLIVAVLIIAAIAIALILSSQLEKTERRADAIQAAREEILSEKVTLEAQTTTLQERLSAVTDQHLDLKNQIDALRRNEEKHKRTQSDLGRFRRQNELLRSQITGLELEKVALARQLEAVKALADADPDVGGDGDFAGDGDPFDPSGAAVLDGSSPAPEEVGGIAAKEEPQENADAPVPAESAAAPGPVVPEPVVSEPVVSEPVVPEPVVSEPVAPEPVVPEPVVTEPVVTEPVVPEPVVAAEPDAIDVESLRERAAEAMEKAAGAETAGDVVPAAVTAEMDRALREGRAVPGTLAESAAEAAKSAEETTEEAVAPGGEEDAGDRESFPEGEEGVAAEPEAAEPTAEDSAAEPAAETAPASEYVTLDPDAQVPEVQADGEKSE